MAGVNQIPKLSYWASSTDVNKMIMMLNQVIVNLEQQIATNNTVKIANLNTEFPNDAIEGSIGVELSTTSIYIFTGGTWLRKVA